MILKTFNLAQVRIDKLSIVKMGCPIDLSSSKEELCTVNDIRLIWKFGNNYVFDKALDENFKSFKRYEIPSNLILSTEQIFIEKKIDKK